MQSTDSDLPSVPVTDTQSGRPQFTLSVPLAHLRQPVILSTVVAVLAFVLFVLTFLWDENLWMAAIVLPIGCVAAGYAFWCGRVLVTSAVASE